MAKPVSILLADDDPEDQAILKEYLLEENPSLSIHCVRNGKEAVSWLNARPSEEIPSLIILDYKMPLLNGVETLMRIKETERFAGIPKVVWSTSDQAEHRKQCIETGAEHYFLKPVNSDDLAKMARQMLEILFNRKANKQ
jgi:two-component response regulator ARR-A family